MLKLFFAAATLSEQHIYFLNFSGRREAASGLRMQGHRLEERLSQRCRVEALLSPSLGRLALLAGATGPPLHVAVFLVDGFIHPAYDPVSDFVSELSRGDLGWLQVANCLVLGACLLAFAGGIRWGARRGPGSAAGAALFVVIGAGYIVSGLFVTDAHGASVQTPAGTIHNFAGLLIAAGLIATCFIFTRRFQGPMRAYSLASGIFVLLFFLLTFLAGFPLGIIGILQRITIIAALAWVTVLALTLRADSSSGESASLVLDATR